MKLFDFIKVAFKNSDDYDKLSKYDKSKNRFMFQRFMAIKFPDTADLLNINGTEGSHVVDSFRLISKNFGRTPGWIYTKLPKNTKIKKEFKPEDETIKAYLKQNKASMRDYREMLKTPLKDKMLKELKDLEKFLHENSKY